MEQRVDVLIVGGGTGGCAAALAACEAGASVIMTEESPWIGGQLTSQAVPPDENPWIEAFGGSESYQRMRTLVRDAFRARADVRAPHQSNARVNPGGGWVSALCAPPSAFLGALEAMLAPHVAEGRLQILRQCSPIYATTEGDRILSVEFKTNETPLSIKAEVFIDATEAGDLLVMANVERVDGAEAKADTGEPNAAEVANPRNQQAITWCFAMAADPGHSQPIEKPADYGFWTSFRPSFWPGPLLGWDDVHPITLKTRRLGLYPGEGDTSMFEYRKIVDGKKHEPAIPSVTLVNWPLNDAFLTPYNAGTLEERVRAEEEARTLSKCLAYWLQNDAPRPDGTKGYPELRLSPETMGTPDGLALRPYIRESTRLVAHHRITEQELSPETRPNDNLAERYPDSVGIGYYRIDLHPSTGGDNYIDVASLPFRIPLRALIPVRIENLLAGAKNIGTTHITNGCYRLHPVEWSVGEAAGALAARCAQLDHSPQQYVMAGTKQQAYLDELDQRGVRRAWPEDLRRPE